jgi:hypothetical protein
MEPEYIILDWTYNELLRWFKKTKLNVYSLTRINNTVELCIEKGDINAAEKEIAEFQRRFNSQNACI